MLHALAERHGARRLRVFGSVARGDATEGSDVDFVVEMEHGRSLFDLGALQIELSEALGRKVDIVTEGLNQLCASASSARHAR
ncbi:MAG: nucleotidyltransferase family protein [Geminicoccaceae bacterium]